MKRLILTLIVVTCLPLSARAIEFESSQAELVSAVEGVGPLEVVPAGLKIALPEGWYTYWRMPGDSGLAPKFNWRETKNIENIDVLWPMPKRFEVVDMHSFGYGYGGDVYLPLDIHVTEPGKPVEAEMVLEMMICKEICIPETHEVKLRIDKGSPLDTPYAQGLRDARELVPVKGDTPRLKLMTAVLGKDSIVVTAEARDGFEDTELLLEVPDNFMNTPPELYFGDDETRAVIKVNAPEYIDDLTGELFGEKITVTLINKGEAVEKDFQF